MTRITIRAGLLSIVIGLACCTPPAAAQAVYPLSNAEYVPGSPGNVIEVLDFNGDGVLDIASAKGRPTEDGEVTLLLGTPTGWEDEQSVAIPGVSGFFTAIAAADITGDGLDDILATYGASASLVLVRGNASGTLTAPAPADVHSISGAFHEMPNGVDWGDVDGDSDLDVVTVIGLLGVPGGPEGKLTIFLNDGSGGLTASDPGLSVAGPGDVLLLPLGDDDDLDLVVAQSREGAAGVKVFPGGSGATFGAGVDVSPAPNADRLDWGDFDGDDRIDVAVSYRADLRLASTVLRGISAAPGLGPGTDVDAAVDGHEVAAGDLDRDGRDDLLVADAQQSFVGDTPIFLRSLGTLGFERVDSHGNGEFLVLSPRVGDVDGDGKLDVVTSGSSSSGFTPDGYFIRYGLGPELLPDHVDVDFGFVTLGTRAAGETFRFRNAGPGIAAAIERAGDGDLAAFPIERDTCSGASLAVGATCELTIAYVPPGEGDHEAVFSAFAADADFLNPVGVFGTGVPVAPPGRQAAPPVRAPGPTPAAPPALRLAQPIFTPTTRAAFARRGLRFTQRFPTAGRARWTLEIPASGGRKRVIVGRATRAVKKAGRLRVTIRATASGRRTMKRRGTTRLVLRTSFRIAGIPTSVPPLRLTSRARLRR